MKKAYLLLIASFVSYTCIGQKLDLPDTKGTDFIFIDAEVSLSKQIDNLRGEIIYLDIWSTYCSPCIAEFIPKKELYPYFQENNIISLYLCIDDYKSDLKVSDKCRQFLGHGFPHHMIIDQNGKVAFEKAYRPSKREELLEQLNSIVY